MRISRPGVLSLLLLSSFLPASIIAQGPETLKVSQNVTAIEQGMAQELSKEQPTVFVKRALMRDRAVVEKSGPKIVEELKRAGHSADDAGSRLVWSWYLLRLGRDSLPLEKELSPAIIQAKAAKLGKLIVKSEPNGASILVDEVRWPAGTNSDGFADVGQRRVRVEKSGSHPAEAICDVARNRVVTFSAHLGPSGSRADCK